MSKAGDEMFERAVKQRLTMMRRNDPALLKFCVQRVNDAADKGAYLRDLPAIVTEAVTAFDLDIK